jgi:hypothetical protein
MAVMKMKYKYCFGCKKRVHVTKWTFAQAECNDCIAKRRQSFTPDEKPECCGKVVPSYQIGANGQPIHNQKQIWMCTGCGKILGTVDDGLTPKELLKAMYNDHGEKWMAL